MEIGKNIAEIRKKRGLTQEELGAKLGVTNQAVSKWENQTSLPDVMLLPEIAAALGVTLNDLYGIEGEKPQKVRADDFPAAAKNMLTEYFIRQAGAFPANAGEPGDHIQLLGCVSNTAGTVFVSRDISVIENTFHTPGSEKIFERKELILFLKKMTDPMMWQVFAYLYRSVCQRRAANPDLDGRDELLAFTVRDIVDGCGLNEEDVLESLEKLTSLHLIDYTWFHDGVTEYYFSMDYAQFALMLFHLLDLLFTDSRTYVLWRDTAKIQDYLFEKLW